MHQTSSLLIEYFNELNEMYSKMCTILPQRYYNCLEIDEDPNTLIDYSLISRTGCIIKDQKIILHCRLEDINFDILQIVCIKSFLPEKILDNTAVNLILFQQIWSKLKTSYWINKFKQKIIDEIQTHQINNHLVKIYLDFLQFSRSNLDFSFYESNLSQFQQNIWKNAQMRFQSPINPSVLKFLSLPIIIHLSEEMILKLFSFFFLFQKNQELFGGLLNFIQDYDSVARYSVLVSDFDTYKSQMTENQNLLLKQAKHYFNDFHLHYFFDINWNALNLVPFYSIVKFNPKLSNKLKIAVIKEFEKIPYLTIDENLNDWLSFFSILPKATRNHLKKTIQRLINSKILIFRLESTILGIEFNTPGSKNSIQFNSMNNSFELDYFMIFLIDCLKDQENVKLFFKDDFAFYKKFFKQIEQKVCTLKAEQNIDTRDFRDYFSEREYFISLIQSLNYQHITSSNFLKNYQYVLNNNPKYQKIHIIFNLKNANDKRLNYFRKKTLYFTQILTVKNLHQSKNSNFFIITLWIERFYFYAFIKWLYTHFQTDELIHISLFSNSNNLQSIPLLSLFDQKKKWDKSKFTSNSSGETIDLIFSSLLTKNQSEIGKIQNLSKIFFPTAPLRIKSPKTRDDLQIFKDKYRKSRKRKHLTSQWIVNLIFLKNSLRNQPFVEIKNLKFPEPFSDQELNLFLDKLKFKITINPFKLNQFPFIIIFRSSRENLHPQSLLKRSDFRFFRLNPPVFFRYFGVKLDNILIFYYKFNPDLKDFFIELQDNIEILKNRTDICIEYYRIVDIINIYHFTEALCHELVIEESNSLKSLQQSPLKLTRENLILELLNHPSYNRNLSINEFQHFLEFPHFQELIQNNIITFQELNFTSVFTEYLKMGMFYLNISENELNILKQVYEIYPKTILFILNLINSEQNHIFNVYLEISVKDKLPFPLIPIELQQKLSWVYPLISKDDLVYYKNE